MDPVAALRTPTRTDSHQDTQPIIFTSALLSLIFNKPMRPRANKQADRDAGAWGPVRFRNVYPAGPCPIASSASSSLPKIVAPSTIYLFAQLIYNARKIHTPDIRACGVSRRSMRIITRLWWWSLSLRGQFYNRECEFVTKIMDIPVYISGIIFFLGDTDLEDFLCTYEDRIGILEFKIYF